MIIVLSSLRMEWNVDSVRNYIPFWFQLVCNIFSSPVRNSHVLQNISATMHGKVLSLHSCLGSHSKQKCISCVVQTIPITISLLETKIKRCWMLKSGSLQTVLSRLASLSHNFNFKSGAVNCTQQSINNRLLLICHRLSFYGFNATSIYSPTLHLSSVRFPLINSHHTVNRIRLSFALLFFMHNSTQKDAAPWMIKLLR